MIAEMMSRIWIWKVLSEMVSCIWSWVSVVPDGRDGELHLMLERAV
jgi:hypothetical protein